MAIADCIFCEIVKHKAPAEIVYENDLCMAFLDRYPQTRGHLQLIPKKHYRYIYDDPQMGQIFAIARRIIHVIIPVLKADHITLGSFGHQIKHAHIWIVPHYSRGGIITEKTRYEGGRALSETANILKTALAKEV